MLILVSFAVVMGVVCIRFKTRFEVLLPAYVGFLILLCYGLALFKGLALFDYIQYGLALAALAMLAVFLRRNSPGEIFRSVFAYAVTPGTVAFVLLAGWYAYAMQGHIVTAQDDLNFWAVQVKSLYAQQGFVDAYHSLVPRFMSYTPGMQLFQWIGLQVAGTFSEGTLFTMLALFYASFLLPFAQSVTWKKAYLLPIVLAFTVAAPTFIFRDAFTMLRVDAALGVSLGYALCQAWTITQKEHATWPDYGLLALTLSTLILVKQIGVGLAILPLSILVFLGKRAPGRRVKVGALLLASCAVFLSWIVFAHFQQLNSLHQNTFRTTLNSITSNHWQLPATFAQLPDSLWGALRYHNAAALINSPTSALVYLPLLFWIVAAILLPLLLGALQKKGDGRIYFRLSLWWLVHSILLLLIFTVIFLTAFVPEFDSFISTDYQRLQYLMERYIGAFLMGGLLLGCHMAIRQRLFSQFGVPVALVGLLLLSNWGQLSSNLIPSEYRVSEPTDIWMYQEENFWVDDIAALEDPLSAIVLYGVEPTPDRPERLQYALAPVKVFTFYGGLDVQGFIRMVRENHITHVLCVDDSNPTYSVAQQFVEDGYLDTYTLYAIHWDGDTPVLTF